MMSCQLPKKAGEDWHPADVIAALKKQKKSLRQLSIAAGYKPATLSNALRTPWPKAEQIIAEAIGLKPEQIWPRRHASRKP